MTKPINKGTDEHEQNQHALGQGRPQIKITGGKPGGRDDRRHLEERMPHGVTEANTRRARVQDDQQCRCGNHTEIGAQFFAFQRLPAAPDQHEKIQIEVDAEQHHEDGDDPLNIG